MPAELAKFACVGPLPPYALPTSEVAMQSYRSLNGRDLPPYSTFGRDPLEESEDAKKCRDDAFFRSNPGFDAIFHEAVNGNGTAFENAVFFYINISNALCIQYNL